jgi:hypothetical protein
MLRMPRRTIGPMPTISVSYGALAAPPPAIADELATRFDLRVVRNWSMPALGVDCFVMEAAATYARAADRGLSHDAR